MLVGKPSLARLCRRMVQADNCAAACRQLPRHRRCTVTTRGGGCSASHPPCRRPHVVQGVLLGRLDAIVSAGSVAPLAKAGKPKSRGSVACPRLSDRRPATAGPSGGGQTEAAMCGQASDAVLPPYGHLAGGLAIPKRTCAQFEGGSTPPRASPAHAATRPSLQPPTRRSRS